MMRASIKGWAWLLHPTLVLVACTSPEAQRARGSGPGADVGNRGPAVEIHAGAEPYLDTPCVTTLPRCDGPPPTFGPE